MPKQPTTTPFIVEPTAYGWAVRAGTERVGLFMTQRDALNDVKKRCTQVDAQGRRTTVELKGAEPDVAFNNRDARRLWNRR